MSTQVRRPSPGRPSPRRPAAQWMLECGSAVRWPCIWVWLCPPLIVWTDGSPFSSQRSQYVWQNARPWGCHMRRLRRLEIIQGVVLASPAYRESIVVAYMQKQIRRSLFVMLMDLISVIAEFLDRTPFCALIARPITLVRCLRVAVTSRVWPRPLLMWRAPPGRGVAIKAKSQKAEPRRSESQITSPVNHTRVWGRPALN